MTSRAVATNIDPVTNMISVHMIEKDHMDVVQPRIIGTADRSPWLNEYLHARRVFEEHSPVECTKFSFARPEWCNHHITLIAYANQYILWSLGCCSARNLLPDMIKTAYQ